jgi:DNA-binding NarL/FixJ family response regulator
MSVALAREIARDVDMLPVKALRRAFDALVARSSTPVLVLDGEMRVLVANEAARVWLQGRAQEELHAIIRRSHSTFDITIVDSATRTRLLVGQPDATRADLVSRVEAASRRWQLTARQRDVLLLLVQGEPNKQIADHLEIAVATVEVHVSAILRASRAGNRARVVSLVNAIATNEAR